MFPKLKSTGIFIVFYSYFKCKEMKIAEKNIRITTKTLDILATTKI